MVAPVFSDGDLGPDIRRKLNEMGVAFEAAIAGAYGPQGWAPKLLVVSDGERRVLQLVDWISGQGTKPTLLGYLGNVGIVSDIAEAIDIRGATGATGPNGADGVDGTPVELQTSATHIQWRYVGSGTWTNLVALSAITGATGADGTDGIDGSNGWTPVFANVADGSRFVQQITDWVGGEGTKPATGKYVGATGLVTLIADAVDIRGASGAGSGDVVGPVSSTTGHIAVFADGTGKVLSSGGALGSAAFVDTSAFATAAQGIKADTAIQSTEKGAANGVASLGADSKIPSSQLPSIAITDVFVVGSETEMLELTAQKGDIAVRSDLEKTYALSAEPASTLANWVLLRTPTDSVLSVAGKTGVVSLVKGDVGLGNVDNTSDLDKAVSTATQTALNDKVTGQAGSVDGEIALFSGTGGKTIKRSALDGIIKSATGVASTAVAGTDYVAPGVATTFTAQQTFKEVKDTVYAITDGNFAIDPGNGSIQTVTISVGRTPTAANFEAGQIVLLGIQGNFTITWSSVAVTWVKAGGTASAPNAAASGYLWVMLWKVGTTIYGTEVGKV